MLNHTIFDLRIAASLIICFYCQSISDAEDGKEIAQEIKKSKYEKSS
jgi:hypothetical protein